MKTLCKPVLSYHHREQWLWYARFIEEKTKGCDHLSLYYVNHTNWPRFNTYLHPQEAHHYFIPCWQADLNLYSLPESLIPEMKTEIPMRCYACPIQSWRWLSLTDNTCCERVSEVSEALSTRGYGGAFIARNIVANMEWNWDPSETVKFFHEVNKGLCSGKTEYNSTALANKELTNILWEKYTILKNRYFDRHSLIRHMWKYGAKLCK